MNAVFESGNIYGIYGRNGCGKTMLLRAMCGLIYPTEGEIIYDDKILHKDMDFPENIGIIIEHAELLPQYDAYTNLKLLADIRGKIGRSEIREVLKRVELDPDDKKRQEKGRRIFSGNETKTGNRTGDYGASTDSFIG